MMSVLAKWFVSAAAGLVIGLLAFFAVGMFPFTGGGAGSGGGVIVLVLVAALMTFVLARSSNMTRRIGWACVAAGLSCFVGLLGLALFSDVTVFDLFRAAPETRDQATAFFFLLLFAGLPALLGGIVLTVGGGLLLQRGRTSR